MLNRQTYIDFATSGRVMATFYASDVDHDAVLLPSKSPPECRSHAREHQRRLKPNNLSHGHFWCAFAKWALHEPSGFDCTSCSLVAQDYRPRTHKDNNEPIAARELSSRSLPESRGKHPNASSRDFQSVVQGHLLSSRLMDV